MTHAHHLAVGTLALFAAACGGYSPHAIPQGSADTDVHARSLARLYAAPAPADALRFAVIGDTQADFDETQEIITLLNARTDLSFAIQVGDFTHQGIGPEYEAMNAEFRRLDIPYFVVVGNHDLLANGGDIYDHMFGSRNLVFTYARTRFVLFDSNGVEYGYGGLTPDLEMLRNVLTSADVRTTRSALTIQPAIDTSFDRAILVAHVDPSNADWDPVLRDPYYELVRELGVEVSFYGHGHEPHEFEQDGSRFYIPGAVDRRTFLIATVNYGGSIDVERVWF